MSDLFKRIETLITEYKQSNKDIDILIENHKEADFVKYIKKAESLLNKKLINYELILRLEKIFKKIKKLKKEDRFIEKVTSLIKSEVSDINSFVHSYYKILDNNEKIRKSLRDKSEYNDSIRIQINHSNMSVNDQCQKYVQGSADIDSLIDYI